mmetsp:Transcript_24577/g.62426  ORF Transcript_24577/g.62426 Transcript_24577/m.62426 type:complete len:390 (-) Transcript_24577:2695-3864(-)
MFGHDPFKIFREDPFFNSAFGGHDPFAPFAGPLFGSAVPQQHQQGHQNRAPMIEEVHGDHASTGNTSQPIVEEPDEDDPLIRQKAQRQRRTSPQRSMSTGRVRPAPAGNGALHAPGSSLFGFGGLGGFGGFGSILQEMQNMASAPGATAFSYSTSSYQSMGPGGVTYQATHTQRAGPGGVRESQSTVRDGRTGQQTITVARGLGDKERVMTRTRDATGREQARDDLRGISAHEAHTFDQEWRTHAERSLLSPSLGRAGAAGSMGRVGAGARAGAAAPPAALPAPAAAASAYGYSNAAGAAGGYGAGAGGYGSTAPYAPGGSGRLGGVAGNGYGAAGAGGSARMEQDSYPHRAPHHASAAPATPGAGVSRTPSMSRTGGANNTGYTGRYV